MVDSEIIKIKAEKPSSCLSVTNFSTHCQNDEKYNGDICVTASRLPIPSFEEVELVTRKLNYAASVANKLLYIRLY